MPTCSRRPAPPAGLQAAPVLTAAPLARTPPARSDRVRRELFGGAEAQGAHRSGSEGAAAVILGYAAAAYAVYAFNPSPLSGFLLGLGGAWIGLTVQHCGNHGARRGGRGCVAGAECGLARSACRLPFPALRRPLPAPLATRPAPRAARRRMRLTLRLTRRLPHSCCVVLRAGAMSTKVWVNQAMGLTDDLIGGSSLAWRYHHQVSHHIHCNGARHPGLPPGSDAAC